MSGSVMRILEKTAYDFSLLTSGLATGEIAVATNVDVTSAREVTILLRVHAKTFSATGAPKIDILVRGSAPTDEDPGLFFRDVASAITTTILTANTAPYLVRIAVPPNIGAWMTVLLQATQGTSTATLTASLSMDVVLKD